MSIFETAARGGAISLLVLLTVVLLRDARSAPAARYGALFALSAAANLIVTMPAVERQPSLWLVPLRILASGNPAVFWVLTRALFDDEFVPSWRHWTVWLALVGAGFWAAYSHAAMPFLPLNALSLLCVLAAAWSVLAGQAGDLVEVRRRMRLVFVVSVAVFTAAMLSSSILAHGGPAQIPVRHIDAVGNLAMAGFFALALLTLDPGDLFVATARPTRRPPPGADPRETTLLAALRREMDVNRAYREEGLNIAALAARLGIPEYRLRRLINQRLGHRNFSAFLNGYRLDEAAAALADRTQAEVPVLTIALDAGFQSIGPFNRAFRTKTGMTPTEYRRQHLGG